MYTSMFLSKHLFITFKSLIALYNILPFLRQATGLIVNCYYVIMKDGTYVCNKNSIIIHRVFIKYCAFFLKIL